MMNRRKSFTLAIKKKSNFFMDKVLEIEKKPHWSKMHFSPKIIFELSNLKYENLILGVKIQMFDFNPILGQKLGYCPVCRSRGSRDPSPLTTFQTKRQDFTWQFLVRFFGVGGVE